MSDREIKKREIDKLKAIEIEKIKNATMEKEKEKEAKQKEIANFRAMLEDSIEDDGEKKEGLDEKSKEQRRRERLNSFLLKSPLNIRFFFTNIT